MAKELLSQGNVEFEEFDVSKDGDALAEMLNLSGSRSVPVISGCGEVIVGFDKVKIQEIIECAKSDA